MPFIIDYRCPETAINRLKEFDDVILFNAGKIVYPAISGHPDIFLCRIKDLIIAASNTPTEIINALKAKDVKIKFGENKIGFRYPQTAYYNVYIDNYIAIVSKHSDSLILKNIHSEKTLTVKQGYIACNMFRIGESYISSDRSIEKALKEAGKTCIFINPTEIKLPGAGNGFIGGTLCEFYGKILFTGNKNSHCGEIIEEMSNNEGKETYFLLKNEIRDIGGIFHF